MVMIRCCRCRRSDEPLSRQNLRLCMRAAGTLAPPNPAAFFFDVSTTTTTDDDGSRRENENDSSSHSTRPADQYLVSNSYLHAATMTMRRRSAVSVGVLLLHLQLCLTFQFQTKHDLGSRVRPRSGAPTIIVSSVMTDEVSPSPETKLRLVAKAVQLKNAPPP